MKKIKLTKKRPKKKKATFFNSLRDDLGEVKYEKDHFRRNYLGIVSYQDWI